MLDPVTSVLAWLKADAGITTLVGANVFAPVLPEGFSCETGPEAIVIRRRGGTRHGEIPPLLEPSIAVEAWSLDSVRARLIFGTCSDLIHGATSVDLGANGFVILAQEEVAGQDTVDPVTHWPMTFGYFRVMLRAQKS
jgi:hypothetical protein